MTIELWLCVCLALIAIPVSQHIFIHYVAFALVNLAFAGHSTADASILAMTFGALAVVDAAMILAGGPLILLVTFITSAALALESTSNGDWLLSHITPISIATNAVIIAYMAGEYRKWMRGRHGR